jgi:type I restriction enzyme M protein
VLEAGLESVSAQLAELEEEQGGEEGAFSELDRVNRASVTARLRELKGLFALDEDNQAEEDVLNAWLTLSSQETELKRKVKEAEDALDKLAYDKYPTLTEADIKTLVVDDKWLSAIGEAIHGEMERISQDITQRVKELAERYETSLPEHLCKVAASEERVSAHLTRMGFAWK